MNVRKEAFGLSIMFLAVSASVASASYQTFLQMDGIQGESVANGHAGEIEVLSFSFGVTNLVTIGSATGGTGPGRASFHEVHITKHLDSTTPSLYLMSASGGHAVRAHLTCRQPAHQFDFMVLTLETVFVTSITSTGAAGGNEPVPTEEVVLAVGKITWEYRSQGPDGAFQPVRAGWDQILNAVVNDATQPGAVLQTPASVRVKPKPKLLPSLQAVPPAPGAPR